MRRLEGGAGAVPRAGVSHMPATGVPGRPSARASGLPSRERGCTDRTNGGAKVRRDHGVMSTCPVSEERSRNEAITAVERRLASARRRGARTPRQACTKGSAHRRSTPSLVWEKEERHTKVLPGIG